MRRLTQKEKIEKLNDFRERHLTVENTNIVTRLEFVQFQGDTVKTPVLLTFNVLLHPDAKSALASKDNDYVLITFDDVQNSYYVHNIFEAPDGSRISKISSIKTVASAAKRVGIDLTGDGAAPISKPKSYSK